MRILVRCVMVGAALFAIALPAAAGGPQTGEPAPAFELPGSDGATYRLADFKDKSVVVLAWFPKAFTGG